jgi:copper(I)-binding protein
MSISSPEIHLTMPVITTLFAALALSLSFGAAAHDFNLKGIAIGHPYATPTVSGAPTGAVYISLTNGTKASDRLVGASTPRAKSVELHSMSMAGDIMRMREVEAIEVKPGQKIEMRPSSGFHLMLNGLASPLKPGDKFPLVLRFEKSGTAKVEVVVEEPKPSAAKAPAHKH